jgi:outer membrane lipoprotein-sorting protein
MVSLCSHSTKMNISLRTLCSFKIILLLLVMVLFPAWSSAEVLPDSERSKYQADFEKRQKETKTFQSKFTQEFRLKGMKEGIVSSGEIFFQRPGSFLIHFESPKHEVVFANAQEFYRKKEGAETIRKPISSKTAAERMVTLLRSLFESGEFASKDFKTEMQKSKNELIVLLVPLNSDLKGKIVNIENRVRLSDLVIQSVVIHLKDEALIRYSFQDQKRNLQSEALIEKFHRIESIIPSQSQAIIPSQKR